MGLLFLCHILSRRVIATHSRFSNPSVLLVRCDKIDLCVGWFIHIPQATIFQLSEIRWWWHCSVLIVLLRMFIRAHSIFILKWYIDVVLKVTTYPLFCIPWFYISRQFIFKDLLIVKFQGKHQTMWKCHPTSFSFKIRVVQRGLYIQSFFFNSHIYTALWHVPAVGFWKGIMSTELLFNIKISPCRYRKSHCGDRHRWHLYTESHPRSHLKETYIRPRIIWWYNFSRWEIVLNTVSCHELRWSD